MFFQIVNTLPAGTPVISKPASGFAVTSLPGEKSLEEFQKKSDDLRLEIDHLKSQIKVLQKRESLLSSALHYTFWSGALAGVISMLFAPPAGLGLLAATGALTVTEGIARVRTYNRIEKKAMEYKDIENFVRQREWTESLVQSVGKDERSSDSISVGDGFVIIDGVRLEKNKFFNLIV